jgi:hypothetical protein
MKPILRSLSLLASFALCVTACHVGPFRELKGNGNIVNEDRKVGSFRTVDARGFFNVYLTQGSESDGYQVRLEGESNLLEYVDTRVEGSKLIIDTRHDYDFQTSQDLNVYITAPQLSKVILAGSGNIVSKNTLSSDQQLGFEIMGSGDVKVSVDAPSVETSLMGSGKLDLSGQTKDLKVDIAGSGTFSGKDLKSENAKVSIMGSGDAYVFASVALDASILASGDVFYYGNPSISQHIVGSGTLTKKD